MPLGTTPDAVAEREAGDDAPAFVREGAVPHPPTSSAALLPLRVGVQEGPLDERGDRGVCETARRPSFGENFLQHFEELREFKVWVVERMLLDAENAEGCFRDEIRRDDLPRPPHGH